MGRRGIWEHELAETELSPDGEGRGKSDYLGSCFFSAVLTACKSACLLASLVPFESCIFFWQQQNSRQGWLPWELYLNMGILIEDISVFLHSTFDSYPSAWLSTLRKQDCPKFCFFNLSEYFGQLNFFIPLKEGMMPKIDNNYLAGLIV